MTASTTRAERVRRMLLGGSLIVGPALIAVGGLLEPAVDWDDPTAVVSTAVEQSGLWQVNHLLMFLGFMLLIPAAIAAGEIVRRRHPGLALAAVILTGASAVMICSVVINDFTLAAVTADQIETVAAYYAQTEDMAGLAPLIPLFFAGIAGILLLAVGLWLSKAVPRWAPVLMAVSIGIVFFVTDGVVADVAEVGLALSFWGTAWGYLTNHPVVEPAAAEASADMASAL